MSNRIVRVAQMREADRRTIEELGMPSAVLMYTAGRVVYRELPPGPACIVCGKGNNGGDGFVVALHALLAMRPVHVLLLADRSDLRGDPLIFLRAYERLGGIVRTIREAATLLEAFGALPSDAVVVDALLGTGISGEVSGLYRTALDHWPQRYTVAVDIPSGLDGDSGLPCGTAVRADATVSFQFATTGLVRPEAQPFVGRLVVPDIGIPDVCADDAAWAALKNRW